MRRYVLALTVSTAVLGHLGCGGDNSTTPPPVTTTTTVPSQPSPSPVASPTPSSQECNLQPGPITRLAITPRELRTDGVQENVLVRARPDWDEVVCIDKDKTHRLDFNANQRNDAGREACYLGTVTWRLVADDDQMVTAQGSRHPEGFIYRYNIEPRGRTGSVSIEAQLDGVTSYPWQSGSGYRREPLRIVAMGAQEIARDCLCIFHGNGQYEGARCSKLNPNN